MRSVKHGGKKGTRYRYKMASVKRQNKKQKKSRKIVGCSVIDRVWDGKLTTRQNMAAMGLAYDPNETIKTASNSDVMEVDGVEIADLAGAKASGTVKQQKAAKMDRTKTNKTSAVLGELEKIAIAEAQEVTEQKQRRRERAKLHQNDVDLCKKMIDKHGEDYEAMSRDPLNIWQNTAKQLERKIAIYRKSVGGKK